METVTTGAAKPEMDNQKAPCACNFRVFSDEEKKRHSELMRKIDAAVAETRELPDGYGFHLLQQELSMTEVAEWIGYERHCCPFFHFELELQPNQGDLWLNLRGGADVKEFLRPDVERRAVFEPKF
jgi:hypothetical protein